MSALSKWMWTNLVWIPGRAAATGPPASRNSWWSFPWNFSRCLLQLVVLDDVTLLLPLETLLLHTLQVAVLLFLSGISPHWGHQELAVCWATVSSQLSHPVILRHKLQNGILISGVDRHCLSDTRLIKCVCVFTEPTRVLVPSLLILYQTLFDIFPFVFCFLGIWQTYGPWRTKCLCAFQVVTPEKYEVKGSIEEAAIVLTACAEPKMQVTITLTSPVIREESGRDGGWKPITALPPSLLFVSPLSCSLSL